jgi:hypothetical protein
MQISHWIIGIALALGLATGPAGQAQATEGVTAAAACPMCGKEMTNAHVGFVVVQPDGKENRFGCAGCGLATLKDAPQDVKTKTFDFLRGDEIDARTAYYVRGSGFTACCEPSFLAFARKDDAERFAKGFGGEVLDFDAALQAVHGAHHHGK